MAKKDIFIYSLYKIRSDIVVFYKIDKRFYFEVTNGIS